MVQDMAGREEEPIGAFSRYEKIINKISRIKNSIKQTNELTFQLSKNKFHVRIVRTCLS